MTQFQAILSFPIADELTKTAGQREFALPGPLAKGMYCVEAVCLCVSLCVSISRLDSDVVG